MISIFKNKKIKKKYKQIELPQFFNVFLPYYLFLCENYLNILIKSLKLLLRVQLENICWNNIDQL